MNSTHVFDAGEVTIAYTEGPDNGPPLVLLHGLTGRRQEFEMLSRMLEDRWHTFTCDLRGHGESGRAPEPGAYLLTDHVRDIVTVVRGTFSRDDRPVLAGYSLGAMVSLGVAAMLPERIRGLFLLEPPLTLRNHRARDLPIGAMLTMAHEITKSSPPFEELLAACRQVFPEADEAFVVGIAIQLSQMDPAVVVPETFERLLEGTDLEATLESIRCPMLIMYGAEDLGSLVTDEDIAWMRRLVPQAEVIKVPTAGHNVHLEQELVTRHIESFLGSL